MIRRFTLALLVSGFSTGCGSDDSGGSKKTLTDDQYKEKIIGELHDTILADIDLLLEASEDIRSSAPAPTDRGWDVSLDAAAIDGSKEAWKRARTAYERQEGAIAPLFPDIDFAIDARYDDFLAELSASGGDTNLYDGNGVTGMHAVERILWSNEIPQRVIDLEKTLPGYLPAAFPATAADSNAFKDELCTRLVTDVTTLRDAWAPTKIHIAIAFQGLISLMNEQREKVAKAASDEEESRYAQRTMVDIRDNLAGTKKAFAIFQPWLESKKNADDPTLDGPTVSKKILDGFDSLDAAYTEVSGDAFPVPPPTWSSENPTPADLATPFGTLYDKVSTAVDPNEPESVVAQMNQAAKIFGFTVFAP